jgi:hypothetical protein
MKIGGRPLANQANPPNEDSPARQARLMNPGAKADMAARRDLGAMADKDQEKRDRELDAWMDRALGVRVPDPRPAVREA